jgi:hypothetical protein
MHYENAVGDHDTNYDQRQQQAGRAVPHHFAFHQKHQLEGETRHGGQQQHVKGQVWRSSCGAHMQFVSTSALSIKAWGFCSANSLATLQTLVKNLRKEAEQCPSTSMAIGQK